MKLGFHGATTMPADLQTDVAASAHARFKTLELWAAKVDHFLADHYLAELQALVQNQNVAPMIFSEIEHLNLKSIYTFYIELYRTVPSQVLGVGPYAISVQGEESNHQGSVALL
jgi:hypothetical protein